MVRKLTSLAALWLLSAVMVFAQSPGYSSAPGKGSGTGSAVSVAGGATLTSANFNAITPAAQASFLNCTFQTTTTNVSLECPNGTTSSTFALGNVLNGLNITSTTGTFTLVAGKTLTVSNSLSLAGTDGTTMTFPSTSATIARTDAAQTFTGLQTFGAVTATGTLTTNLTGGPFCVHETSGVLAATASDCGSGGGLSGMTAGQVPIAATASTVTSSEALAGAGAGIVTGPTSGVTSLDITEFTGTGGQIADSGVAVASLLTNPMTTIGDMIVGGTAGAPSRLPVNATAVPQTVVSVSGATALLYAGVPIDATNPVTLLSTDRAGCLWWTTGSALALPAVSGAFASNFPACIHNISGGTLTITPNAGASDLIDGSATATVLNNFTAFLRQDSTSAPGHWFTDKFPLFQALGSTCTSALAWSTTTGFSCQTAFPLSSLATEAANTTVANVTGSTAAPTAVAIPSGIQNYVAGTGYTQGSAHNLSVPLVCAAASASGTTYTCTTTPSFAPADGDVILFQADVAVTGAATLAVNGQAGPPGIKKQGGGTALVANDMLAGQDTLMEFDGTNWQMQGQSGNAPGAVTSVNTLTGAVVVEAATAGQVAISGGNAAALTGAADLTYATHTFSGISTTIFDLSAATGTAALKVPQTTTNTASAAGAIDFDTTNKNYHGFVNGADSIFLNIAAAPTTGDLLSATVATGNTLASDAGFLATNVVRKDTTNTGAAAMTLDMSASTTANSLKIPSQAGLTSNGTSSIGYDTTNANFHIPVGGADALAAAEAAAIGIGKVPKASSATNGLLAASSMTDNATNVTSTDTGGFVSAPTTAAGSFSIKQGTVASTTTTAITHAGPTAVTSYVITEPGTAAQGIPIGTLSGSVITQGFSGDANHSATVSTSTATSVGSTSLCSSTFCPAGTYRVSAYLDVTTACTTAGSYSVSVIYTDDTTVSKTIVLPFVGLGFTTTFGPTAITSSLVPTSTTDFGTASFILRSTGTTSINYSTAASACGTGGPAVGKLYLTVEAVQ